MANLELLEILRQGPDVWNRWRERNGNGHLDFEDANLSTIDLRAADLRAAEISNSYLRKALLDKANLEEAHLWGSDLSQAFMSGARLTRAKLGKADLSGADLTNADLRGANLIGVNLNRANLSGADLREATLAGSNLLGANLFEANLQEATLPRCNLIDAKLSHADFRRANLWRADLSDADLTRADLREAKLDEVSLISTKVTEARITGSSVYGVNVWDIDGEFKDQKDLVIVRDGQPAITVDNIKVAQFIYLILRNEEIRDVINTLTSKSVLILGRFVPEERKDVLNALRGKLREHNLLPIVFDFSRPTDKDFTETIKTLAGLAYFVIADITNPKSSPLELQATVPDYQIPFVPIIQEGEQPFSMMADLHQKYNWVLPTRSYDSIETLMSALKPRIIDPAVEMRNKLRQIKAKEYPVESLKDYLDKSL